MQLQDFLLERICCVGSVLLLTWMAFSFIVVGLDNLLLLMSVLQLFKQVLILLLQLMVLHQDLIKLHLFSP